MKKTETSSFGTVSRTRHNSSKFYKGRLYQGIKKKKDTLNYTENKLAQVDIIYCADSRNMHHLPDNSVHLMITSPPYNVGKDYDQDMTLEEYKNLLRDVMSETYRVLVEGGRACVNIANIGRTPYIPLHAYLREIAHECDFYMRGEIIWDKGAGAGSSCAWGSWQSSSNPTLRDVHEYILVFCKGTFKRSPIQQNSISRNAFLEHTKSIWRFPAASAKKANHPAPFPIELPSRLIHLYSYIGDIVPDPFIGSGTTTFAALDTGRKFVGYEIDPQYFKRATQSLKSVDQLAFL